MDEILMSGALNDLGLLTAKSISHIILLTVNALYCKKEKNQLAKVRDVVVHYTRNVRPVH
jgi:hypothetical protein